MHRNHVFIAALLCSASVAGAADLAPQGKYDVTACWAGTSNPIEFSKTHSAFTYDMSGASRASEAGTLFDKVSFHCIGLSMAFEGKTSGVTVCEGIDKDGDKYLSHFVQAGTTNTRTHVSGTGKYEGAVLSSSVEGLGPFPVIKAGTFQNCNHQTGTYKLPKLMK
jgi:hypothetical protein